MTELTDLEICKRIAEIEGVKYRVITEGDDVYLKPKTEGIVENRVCSKEFWLGEEYNPLADDALCFQLMVKYNVDIDNTSEGVHATCFCKGFSKPLGRYGFDKNHNKAILKSIIEAHKND